MKLSVLIRNLNEAEKLRATLQTVARQRTSFDVEVVVVDNESNDHSVAVAHSLGCRVITLPRASFSYGGAINLGVRYCQGEVILLMSAHVMLLGDCFLENLMGFFDKPDIGFVRPVNVSKASLIEKSLQCQTLAWPSAAAQQQAFAETEWANLVIANCTAIRRQAALDFPFHEQIEANEDKLWSLQVLKAGWKGVCHIPCYYFYTKRLSPYGRLMVDLKENKTRAEILGKGPYQGSGFMMIIKIFFSALADGLRQTAWRSSYAWKLVRQGKTTKQKYQY
jgi:glycosyltransferase involved in cell wall biosynthesis